MDTSDFVSSVRAQVNDEEIKAPKNTTEQPDTFGSRHPTIAKTGNVALLLVGGAAVSFVAGAAAYAGQRAMRAILPQEKWTLTFRNITPAATSDSDSADPSPVSAS